MSWRLGNSIRFRSQTVCGFGEMSDLGGIKRILENI